MMMNAEPGTPALTARVLTGLFLIVVPGVAVLTARFSGHDLARIVQLALMLACAVCFAAAAIREARNGRAHQAGFESLVLAVACSLAVVAVFHAPSVPMAAREAATLSGLAGIAVITARYSLAATSHRLSAAIVGVAAALYAGQVLLTLGINLLHANAVDRWGAFVGYDNYRFFNHVQTPMLPMLAIATVLPFQRRVFTGLAWVGLVTGFAFLTFSSGRATMVALVAGSALGLVLFRKNAVPYLARFAASAVFGILLYAILFVALPALVGSSADHTNAESLGWRGSIDARFMLWRLALADAASAPWFGIGPMHFAHAPNGEAAHPHNVYLQVAAEWGVPMVVLLLACAGRGLWKLARETARCNDAENRNVGIGLFVASTAIAVDAAFSGNFVMPVPQVWIAFVVGWAWGWTRARSPASAPATADRAPRWLGAGLAALLLASQAWLCASVWPEARHLDAHLEHVKADLSHGDPVLRPRFWSAGWF